MTKVEAIDILRRRVDVDKECFLNGETMSDFDIFIKEQDDAIELAIEALQILVDKEV